MAQKIKMGIIGINNVIKGNCRSWNSTALMMPSRCW